MDIWRLLSVVFYVVLKGWSVCVSTSAIVSAGMVTVDQVGQMVGQIVDKHLNGCHLMLFTTTPNTPILSAIIRHVDNGVVMVTAQSVDQRVLSQGLRGEILKSCRAAIILLDNIKNNNDTHIDTILSLLEEGELRKQPETRVIVVGGMSSAKQFLFHHTFRNTLHAIYLAIKSNIPYLKTLTIHQYIYIDKSHIVGEEIYVYQRCMYCKDGEKDVYFFFKWNSNSSHIKNNWFRNEKLMDMMGHPIKVMTAGYFPYADYEKVNDDITLPTRQIDSLVVRLYRMFSARLNFTYDIYEEPNCIWGMLKNGSFDGMMGRVQREEADCTTIAATSPDRMKYLDYVRAYPSDAMTVVSLKPTLLPQNLALIRPFSVEVWLAVLVSVVVWSVAFWLLQRVWVWMAGGSNVQFNTALLYGWSSLLEHPPNDPSINISGQMLVGLWLLYVLIIHTGYESSLVAHLTVQGKTKPPETLEDLVQLPDWGWGLEPWILTGVPYEYFAKHKDPIVMTIYQNFERTYIEDAMKKILDGRFSLLALENYVTIAVNSRFTNARGRSPFFIGKKSFTILHAFGWFVRKGAPFYPHFRQYIRYVEDSGLIEYWTHDLIEQRVKDVRAKTNPEDFYAEFSAFSMDEQTEIPLGLNHLQGIFYILILGLTLSTFLLLSEIWAHSRTSTHNE